MKIELKNRYSGSVIAIREVDDNERNPLGAAVIQAIQAGISLEHADLRRANLRCADLRRANLRCANLSGADLAHTDLRDAGLSRANLGNAYLSGANLGNAYLVYTNLRHANLSGANLSGANLVYATLRCANLSGADLGSAYLSGTALGAADLSGANLEDVNWGCIRIPVVEDIHKRVYEAASQPGALNMRYWHTCETTHCRAGWAIVLAGDSGLKLEEKYGPSVAACMIYRKSDPEMARMPDFHCSDAEALADMKRMAGV